MRGWLCGVALLAGACTPAEPAPPPKAPPAKLEIPVATAGAEATPEVAEAPPPALAEVREPDQVACRVVEQAWSYDSLRLKDGGAVFAKVYGAPTALALPAGAPGAGTAVLDDKSVLVRGVVAKDDVKLRMRQALALRGFLAPKPRLELIWSGGGDGKLRVGVDASSDLTWPERVEDDVACDKLSLNVNDFDPRLLVTKQAKHPEREIARDGAELAETRGGDAVARLRDGRRVELVQAQGKHSRILVDEPRYVLFGWVASADLRQPGAGLGYGTGYGRLGGRHVSRRGGRVCARDLTLVAELGQERAVVGVLRKDARFVVEEAPALAAPEPTARKPRHERRFLPISLPLTRWLSLLEGARLLVPEEEFKECDPPPAPPSP